MPKNIKENKPLYEPIIFRLLGAYMVGCAILYLGIFSLLTKKPREAVLKKIYQDFRQLGADTRIGLTGLIIGATLVLLFAVAVIGGLTTPNHRAQVSMVYQEFRELGRRLTLYHLVHNKYPPANSLVSVYTFVSDDLTTPAPVLEDFPSSPSHPIYKGPPVDPYRKTKLFSGEKLGKAWYRDGRNSEGPFPYFKGYPPRYYRTADGELILLLSNGPDEKVDLNKFVLDAHASGATAELPRRLNVYTYDATNGLTSSGDLYHIVEPATHRFYD